jgi:hypothetical protein
MGIKKSLEWWFLGRFRADLMVLSGCSPIRICASSFQIDSAGLLAQSALYVMAIYASAF